MKWAVTVWCVCALGCFGPSFESGQLDCPDGLCPSGFRCEGGSCISGVGGGDPDGGRSTDGAPRSDSGTSADAAMSMNSCFGETPIVIVPGRSYFNDTTGGFDNADGCFDDAFGPEHYYELILGSGDVPTSVTFDLFTDDYDVVLRLRALTCEDSAEYECIDEGLPESHTQNISVPGSYFIIVDSHDDFDTGEYELLVTLN